MAWKRYFLSHVAILCYLKSMWTFRHVWTSHIHKDSSSWTSKYNGTTRLPQHVTIFPCKHGSPWVSTEVSSDEKDGDDDDDDDDDTSKRKFKHCHPCRPHMLHYKYILPTIFLWPPKNLTSKSMKTGSGPKAVEYLGTLPSRFNKAMLNFDNAFLFGKRKGAF